MLPLLHKTLGLAGGLLASWGVFASVSLGNNIEVGSILIAAVIAAMAGVFTLRSKVADVWRQEAEGERTARQRIEQELADAAADRAKENEEQREIRHELKSRVAALEAQLKVMEARTDLSAALDAIRQMNDDRTHQVVSTMRDTASLSEQRDQRTHELLEQIRDGLPAEPLEVHEVGEEVHERRKNPDRRENP